MHNLYVKNTCSLIVSCLFSYFCKCIPNNSPETLSDAVLLCMSILIQTMKRPSQSKFFTGIFSTHPASNISFIFLIYIFTSIDLLHFIAVIMENYVLFFHNHGDIHSQFVTSSVSPQEKKSWLRSTTLSSSFYMYKCVRFNGLDCVDLGK